MRRKKSPLKVFTQSAIEHPARLLEWLMFGLIIALLLRVGYFFSGSFEFGVGTAVAIPFVYAIISLFALWLFVSKSTVTLPKGPLLALPFVLYVQLQSAFFAKAPWISEVQGSSLLMAWVVYFVIATALRRRVFLFSLLFALGAMVVYLGSFGLGMVKWRALTPELNAWLAGQSRNTVAPFGHPTEGAFAYLIILPLALVVALLPRFAGFVRLAAGSIALLCTGFVALGGTLTGILAVLLPALFIPFFVRAQWGQRLRFLAGGLGLTLMSLGIFYYGFLPIRSAFETQLEEQSALVEASRWQGALQGFLGDPLFGAGLGSSATEAPKYATFPNGSDTWEVRSVPLQVLSETGVVGLGLFALALGATLGRLFLAWLKEPYFPVDKEAAYRSSFGPGEESLRRSRSKSKRDSKRLKRSSTKKVLLGGIVASLSLGLVYGLFESAWASLLCWLLVAVLLGLGERFTEEKTAGSTAQKPSRLPRYGMAAASCACAYLVIRSVGAHYAQVDAFNAQVGLQVYRDKPFLAFENPADVAQVRRLLDHALDWNPKNADALAYKAESYLMEEFISKLTLQEAGERALELSQQAIQLYPENGYYIHLEANAKALLGTSPEEVQAGYERAASLLPQNVQVLLDWAHYRIRDLRQPEAARELVERILAYDPENEMALELLARINL